MDTNALLPTDAGVKTGGASGGGSRGSSNTRARLYYVIIIIIIILLIGVVVYKYTRPSPPDECAQVVPMISNPVRPPPFCYENMSQYAPTMPAAMRPLAPMRPATAVLAAMVTTPAPLTERLVISTIDDDVPAKVANTVSPISSAAPVLANTATPDSAADVGADDAADADIAHTLEETNDDVQESHDDFAADPLVMMTIEDDALSVAG